MRVKVSDYIADFLSKKGIRQVFTVTGGGAMHLNESFGKHDKLKCLYNHHEQASAIAAEAYFKVSERLAAVCVTTGPGATNAITGVAGAYMDSVPMLVFSGQVRYNTSVPWSGLNLRTMGIQEFGITESVKNMTKYVALVTDAEDIRYHLERAYSSAVSGRQGPAWLDIPLDVQAATVETEKLRGYDEPTVDFSANTEDIKLVFQKLKLSKRPVIIAGAGIRLAGAHDEFLSLLRLLNVPVVTTMSSVDAVATDFPLYVGRCGSTGDRAGNFAVQNSDLLLSVGSRLSFAVTGFNYETWARAAYKIMVDIDSEELKKPQLSVDMPICADALDFTKKLKLCASGKMSAPSEWLEACSAWKKKYPVVNAKHYESNGKTNIYAFYNELTKQLPEGNVLVVSVGTSRVAGSQASIIKNGQRFITNPVCAAMGYGLPAAIGAGVAAGKQIVCVTGEGSLQMNIQELQTIIHNKIQLKLFVINNGGYHSIRQTQRSFFGGKLVGVGEESGDLSFPKLEKIADAYGFSYLECSDSKLLSEVTKKAISSEMPVICEIFVSEEQATEPKSASRRLDDGRMFSEPLENMAPFLPEEELLENMFIPIVKPEQRS